ncbi:ABC-2 type transport system permease protein [Parabacteroides sp. PF5-5]|nr:ABC-2 type transport system permease protein [Parabacteroides sp. PH5-39]MDH6316467.1 ABC-2 type transport system permease protein [Parabacteroides sp. PF5-13]MDH6319977.1 ABC-2 type transport system permease protein [Parabacteroides sp. PH5-13]MDH6323790.1 ABC-2 type transport system permease protein [Parabacteroides sp. PH5-8]MDH6327654.1 ABC-2 type transport system permease protein [Parabacteroides sp. PH5-41]MDH6335455.1 ABC-2 type transport system permease protein [Parabacteroides sp. 
MMNKESRLRYIIKEGIQDSFHIWKEELKNVFKDTGVMIFFFLVPLAYPVLYAFIYDNEVVREAKMVVVDQSDSYLSREFTRRVNATPDVQVVAVCSDMAEAKRMLDEKKAYGILLFPSEFSKDLHTGKQTKVSLYSDMSSLLFYKAFLLSATEVSLDLGKELTARNNPASTDELQQIVLNPIPYESVTMFNSQSGFASFLVPAILILVIQQTLILGIGMLGGTARERNRFHSLVPIARHYNGTLRIVFGKSLAYILLYAVVCLWVLAIVPRLFSLPQVGEPWDVLLFILPYLFACIFLSMTLSGFMTTRESPMLVFVFTSLILLFISGVSWPLASVPPFWKAFGYLFPSTPGIQGFIRINSTGATLSEVAAEYRLLWIQAGFYFITACIIYRYQIIRSERLANKNSSLAK